MTNIVPQGKAFKVSSGMYHAINNKRMYETSADELKGAYIALKQRIIDRRDDWEKPERVKNPRDLDGMIDFCTSMENNLNLRKNLRVAKELFNERKKNKVRRRKNAVRNEMNALPTAEQVTQQIDLFGTTIEFLGSSFEDGTVRHKFIIGEHVAKPNIDSLEQNAIKNPRDKAWIKKMKTCGINRPSLEVHVTASWRMDNISKPMIRIPLSEYNLAQPDFLIMANGESFDLKNADYPNQPWEYLGDSDHPVAVAHLHSRLRERIYKNEFYACMQGYKSPVTLAIRENDWVKMAGMVYMFMTNFDLYDGWVKYCVTYFSERHLSDCETNRPVWIPQFVAERHSGEIHFLNKPELYEYDYEVTLFYEGDNKQKAAGTFNTDTVPKFTLDDVTAVKITTNQNKSTLVNMGRRRG